ncbi:DUF3592 domain-containing protein [Natronolimnobius sp. AArcel1]|uniref:DUF3592 domain-containing protein n=1 Tax=Natronolimnobius sp. AArcel1 TaxID=1679093 RepID=UPI001F14F18B|nr:DUF3592 domain-containing protein [Natronolimnobius sp. AArcel1]
MDDKTKYALMIVAGLAVLWYGYADYQTQDDRLENAIEVDATILETDIDRRSSSNSGTSYYPDVEFEYEYEGETYISSNIDAASSRAGDSSRSAAQSVLDEYPEGEEVTVYLDPSEPDEAFLENDRSYAPLLFVLAGAAIAIAGAVYLFRTVREERQHDGSDEYSLE